MPNYMDRGPQPFITDICQAARDNPNYRTTLWTGKHLQLTLMCIPAGGEIGLEAHPNTDQFLRVESGSCLVMMGPQKNALQCRRRVQSGCAIFVPAGTWHNVVNTGRCPLKLSSIYAPPEHPHGTVHATKAVADLEGD